MGVSKNASDQDIKKAYRELARKFHPDVNPNDLEATEKFKEVSAAFEVLSNPQSRSEYDTFGTVGNRSGSKPFTSVFDDIFSQFFGEQQRAKTKGQNIIVELSVTLQQVLKGDEVKISFQRRSVCEKCQGKGGTLNTCPHCGGVGSKIIRGRGMTVKTSCHACNGSGNIVGQNCEYCEGGYTAPTTHTIDFQVFKGVENGMRFIQKSMGEPSLHDNGIPGDLCIVLNVEQSKLFDRQPMGDLFLNWTISYSELVLGTEIEIPTIEGFAKLKIPAGTQPETRFRLKEMGLPIFNQNDTIYQRGDHYVVLKLEVPKNINDDHKILFQKLFEIEKNDIEKIRKNII